MATGVQLDVLGKYQGVVRTGLGPNGPITLSDADFVQFITLAIGRNTLKSSLAVIQTFLHTFFPDSILVFDHENMRMSYYLSSTSTSEDLAVLFIQEGFLPKPLGVQLSSVIYAPLVVLQSFFGCRTYALPAYHDSPLNNYPSYQLTYPFLSYSYVLETL